MRIALPGAAILQFEEQHQRRVPTKAYARRGRMYSKLGFLPSHSTAISPCVSQARGPSEKTASPKFSSWLTPWRIPLRRNSPFPLRNCVRLEEPSLTPWSTRGCWSRQRSPLSPRLIWKPNGSSQPGLLLLPRDRQPVPPTGSRFPGNRPSSMDTPAGSR